MVQRNNRYLDNNLLRDFTRFILKVALVVLSVAGCTQSVTWLGETTQSSYSYRRAPAVYDRYNRKPATQVVEEIQEDYYDEQF